MRFGTFYWLIYRVIKNVHTLTVSICLTCIADQAELWTASILSNHPSHISRKRLTLQNSEFVKLSSSRSKSNDEKKIQQTEQNSMFWSGVKETSPDVTKQRLYALAKSLWRNHASEINLHSRNWLTEHLLVFRRKDLCEGKHDARVENFVSNFTDKSATLSYFRLNG